MTIRHELKAKINEAKSRLSRALFEEPGTQYDQTDLDSLNRFSNFTRGLGAAATPRGIHYEAANAQEQRAPERLPGFDEEVRCIFIDASPESEATAATLPEDKGAHVGLLQETPAELQPRQQS